MCEVFVIVRSSRLSWDASLNVRSSFVVRRSSCFLEFAGVFCNFFLQLLCNAFATEWECRPEMSWGFCCYCWWPLVRSLCLCLVLIWSHNSQVFVLSGVLYLVTCIILVLRMTERAFWSSDGFRSILLMTVKTRNARKNWSLVFKSRPDSFLKFLKCCSMHEQAIIPKRNVSIFFLRILSSGQTDRQIQMQDIVALAAYSHLFPENNFPWTCNFTSLR